MAMSFFFSNMFLHYHYLGNTKPHNATACFSQYTTANHVSGHGMRQLPKPLHIRRIGVWALNNESKREEGFTKESSINKPREEEQDGKPFRISCTGLKAYPDELDVLSLLDPPPKYSDTLKRTASNLAVKLWKRIEDIPEERRHHLLSMLKQRNISRMWEIAGMHANDTRDNSGALMLPHMESKPFLPQFWRGKISGGHRPFPVKGKFKMAFFRDKNAHLYGRVLLGGLLARMIANTFCPLYFIVRDTNAVPVAENIYDLVFEFGDGQLQLLDFPQRFPKPAEHPRPFNGQLIYIRSAGPNVLVGQAWRERRELEQVSREFWGEILLIKDCTEAK